MGKDVWLVEAASKELTGKNYFTKVVDAFAETPKPVKGKTAKPKVAIEDVYVSQLAGATKFSTEEDAEAQMGFLAVFGQFAMQEHVTLAVIKTNAT